MYDKKAVITKPHITVYIIIALLQYWLNNAILLSITSALNSFKEEVSALIELFISIASLRISNPKSFKLLAEEVISFILLCIIASLFVAIELKFSFSVSAQCGREKRKTFSAIRHIAVAIIIEIDQQHASNLFIFVFLLNKLKKNTSKQIMMI